MVKINRPRGTRDFLPQEMWHRRAIENRLREVVQRWGYEEIKTPTFEHLELFTIKSGEAILGEIYNFVDKGNREMALRPELTAPVMRLYVDSLQRAPKPVKLFYFDNCFRYERPQKGRFREFWQFGAELIGSNQPEADAEIVALASEMLESVGVRGELHIGHLGIIRHITSSLEAEQQSTIMRLVDKKDEAGLEAYLEEIHAPVSLREKLFNLLCLSGEDALLEVKNIAGSLPELEEFSELLRLLELFDVEYTVDFSIARGLDYYTGMVFEIYNEGLGAQNQICGGGSFRLTHLFGGQDTPSTGFAIGFDRIMEVCSREVEKPGCIYVACFDDTRTEAVRLAHRLREHVVVHMDVMRRRFKEQLKDANNLGADFVVILGRDEVDSGRLTLKNMQSGEQERVGLEELIERIKRQGL